MSIRIIEGFDFYRSEMSDAERKYVITTSAAGEAAWGTRFRSPGRWGGYSFKAETEGYLFRSPPIGTQVLVTCGIAVRFNTPADTCRLLSMRNVLGNENCTLLLRRSGTTEEGYLEVTNGSTLLGASTIRLEPDVWHYIEMRVFTHPSSGTVTVRVGEQNAILLFGANTAGSGTANIGFVEFQTLSNAGLNDYVEVDDFYIVDGVAPNNGFLGDVVVEAQYPIADSQVASDTQWTVVGTIPDGFDAVDDLQNTDDDDTYITSNITGQRFLFRMTDLEVLTGAIEGVSIEAIGRLDLANPGDDRVLRGSARYTPTSTLFATNNTMLLGDSNTYEWIGAVYETNGATGADWTRQDISSTLFGVEVVS